MPGSNDKANDLETSKRRDEQAASSGICTKSRLWCCALMFTLLAVGGVIVWILVVKVPPTPKCDNLESPTVPANSFQGSDVEGEDMPPTEGKSEPAKSSVHKKTKTVVTSLAVHATAQTNRAREDNSSQSSISNSTSQRSVTSPSSSGEAKTTSNPLTEASSEAVLNNQAPDDDMTTKSVSESVTNTAKAADNTTTQISTRQ